MTVALGSWYMYLMYGAIAAVIGIVLLIVSSRKREEYAREVRGKYKVVIHRATGHPLVKIVKEGIDGWVRVDKGDYKLPDDTKQREAFAKLSEIDKRIVLTGLSPETIEKLTDEEKHILLGDRMVIPSSIEWDDFPDSPFLGIKSSRVKIRRLDYLTNDPRPITWLRDREPEVTTAEAQAHTRQLDAMIAGVRAQELESKSRQMLEAFQRIADKNLVYILLVANVIIGIVIAIMVKGIKVPLP